MTDATTRTSLAPPAADMQIVAEQVQSRVQYKVCSISNPNDGATWSVALGYRRFREFDQGDHAGQDWCAVGAGGGRCVGVVADGVSQSFMGDLAAQRAGAALWQQLLEQSTPFTIEDVRAWFERFGANIRTFVAEYPLTAGLPEMLKNSLEGKRTQHGSQTVLAAFTLDLTTRRAQVLLLGDVRVVVHHDDGRIEHIEADARARWSSLKGLRGEPLLRSVEGVSAIVVFSDGLEGSYGDDVERAFDTTGFSTTAEAAAERDDVSLVAVTNRAPTPKVPLPDGTTRALHVSTFSAEDSQEKTTVQGAVQAHLELTDQSYRALAATSVPQTVVGAPSTPLDLPMRQPQPPTRPHNVQGPPEHEATRPLVTRDFEAPPSALAKPPPPDAKPPRRENALSWIVVSVIAAVLVGFGVVIVLFVRAIVGEDPVTTTDADVHAPRVSETVGLHARTTPASPDVPTASVRLRPGGSPVYPVAPPKPYQAPGSPPHGGSDAGSSSRSNEGSTLPQNRLGTHHRPNDDARSVHPGIPVPIVVVGTPQPQPEGPPPPQGAPASVQSVQTPQVAPPPSPSSLTPPPESTAPPTQTGRPDPNSPQLPSPAQGR